MLDLYLETKSVVTYTWHAADEPVRPLSNYRWAVLAAGTFAQATYSAIWFGVAVMAPALRRELDLSLSQTGLLISASLVGSVVSLIRGASQPIESANGWCWWPASGLAAWRSWARHARRSFVLALRHHPRLAGGLGASVHSASGRAVFHWFPPAQRGLAMGIRQTAIPLSGFVVSIGLPHVVAAGGVRWGFVLRARVSVRSARRRRRPPRGSRARSCSAAATD